MSLFQCHESAVISEGRTVWKHFWVIFHPGVFFFAVVVTVVVDLPSTQQWDKRKFKSYKRWYRCFSPCWPWRVHALWVRKAHDIVGNKQQSDNNLNQSKNPQLLLWQVSSVPQVYLRLFHMLILCSSLTGWTLNRMLSSEETHTLDPHSLSRDWARWKKDHQLVNCRQQTRFKMI